MLRSWAHKSQAMSWILVLSQISLLYFLFSFGERFKSERESWEKGSQDLSCLCRLLSNLQLLIGSKQNRRISKKQNSRIVVIISLQPVPINPDVNIHEFQIYPEVTKIPKIRKIQIKISSLSRARVVFTGFKFLNRKDSL